MSRDAETQLINDIDRSALVMTAYIPSITLPGQIFSQPAASILLPILAGTSIGFYVRRKLFARMMESQILILILLIF